MQYKNPLHIIRDKDLSSVTPENLKRWRKELMLRFNLGGDTTIKVNGKEFDKQGVLEAFEGMQGDLSLHARILQDPALLNFLEDGNLRLFNGVNAYDRLNEEGLLEEVKDWFTPQMSKTLVSSYRKKDSEAASQVSKVFRFSADMNDLDRNACFSALYGELSLDVISLKLIAQNPFAEGRELVLKSELAEYLNKDRHAYLKRLPSEFSDLRDRYGRAAYQMVYALYQQRQDNYINLDLQTLEILEAGVNISFFGASANNLRWLKDKSKELEHIIKVKRKGLWGKYGEPLMHGCLIYIVLFPIIAFIMYGLGDDVKETRNTPTTAGLVMDSVIDYNYWSKCMTGWFEATESEFVQRELLFDENGRGQAYWEFKEDNSGNGSCSITRIFKWQIIKKGDNENSELRLIYEPTSDSCLLKNSKIGTQNKEQFPLAINWFQYPEGFKFGKVEFTLKQVDTSYLSQYSDASANLRLKVKGMEYLKKLQRKVLFSDYINEKLYSIVSLKEYSFLYLNSTRGMGLGKFAEIRDIEEEPYLVFLEYLTEMPPAAVYFDLNDVRYKNKRGEIVVGNVRLFKTTNRRVVVLEE